VAKATRAVAENRGKLDPDGCLLRFTSQPTHEKTGAMMLCRKNDGAHCRTEFAHFSDRGRLFQPDRGRRFTVIVAGHGCA